MKKEIAVKILMLALFIVISIQGKAQWEYMEPMPTPRALSTASELNGKIFVIGGLPHPDTPVAEVNVYDPATDNWEANVPDLPAKLAGISSAVANGKIYVTGGQPNYLVPAGAVASVYEYDPTGGSWTQKAPMLKPRFYHSSVMVGGKIYVMGGRSGDFPAPLEKTVEMYDPVLDEWTFVADMKTARGVFSAEVVGNKIYVMGGATGPTGSLQSMEVYDPQTNTWTLLDDMPQKRPLHGSAVVNNKILVFGGVSGSGMPWPGTWEFDPQDSTWSEIEVADMPEEIIWFADAVVEFSPETTCIYSFGGGYTSFFSYPTLPPPFVTDAVLKYCPPQQTEIPGGAVSGTWKYRRSPYMVTGDIWVPDGETLIIEPGVEVIFTDHYRFDIQGQLLAVGTKDSMITFTAQDSVTAWNGLRFKDIPVTNDSSKLVYCIVQYGFPNGPTDADKNGGGIAIQSVDKLLISYCEITENRTLGNSSWGGGIVISNGSPHITQNLISNNNAQGGHGGGIAIIESNNAVVTNNIIFNNTADGGGGIAVALGEPVLFNNTITGNNAGHAGALDCIGAAPTIINSIMYGNSSNDFGDEVHLAGELAFSSNFLYCDIEGGLEAFAYYPAPPPSHPGRYEYNIDDNPDFQNIPDDFSLADGSPCIGLGIDSVEVNGVWVHAPKTDYYGATRPLPIGCFPDIGAIEQNECGTTGINQIAIPQEAILLENYPNPLNSTTTIKYELRKSGYVTIKVFNLDGHEVETLMDGFQLSGVYEIEWNSEGLSSGVYIYRLQTDKSIKSGKCILQSF